MNESTARTFKKKYESELDDAKRQGRAKPTSIPLKPQGRPLLLGKLNGLVQQYILAASNRGNVISRNIAVSAAKVIMERYPRLIGSVDIESSHWAQSLFRRMGFRRRQATTSKLEIPEGTLKEIKMLFHHDIVTKVAKFNIPDSLIINRVPVGSTTLAKKNSKTVTIKGSTDKRTITATFAISIRGDFLPMQLIYGGKTKKCLPRFKFPEKLSLSYNKTHYSNEKEACKFIEEILKPYIKQVIERDNLPIDQTAPPYHGCIQRSGDTNGVRFVQRVQHCRCASSCKHDHPPSAARSHCKWLRENVYARKVQQLVFVTTQAAIR